MSSAAARSFAPARPSAAPPLVGPTVAEWAALNEPARERLLQALEDQWCSLDETEMDPLACGDPHHDAIEELRSALRTYYRRFGPRVYVGTDVLVVYPGERPIKPDIIVVRDADPVPHDHWVVAQEGKGIDLAFEIHNKGDWNKDFVVNVKTYARLGIPEYFAYAIGRRRLAAYRLRAPGLPYERLLPQAGRYPSQVLGLDVALESGRVHFYAGNAQLVADRDLIVRLEAAVDEAQDRAEQEQARAEQEQARAEQEQARAEQEQARAEQEQARARAALGRLAESIITILQLRGVPLSDDERGRIAGCDELPTLERWLGRAATVTSAAALFE